MPSLRLFGKRWGWKRISMLHGLQKWSQILIMDLIRGLFKRYIFSNDIFETKTRYPWIEYIEYRLNRSTEETFSKTAFLLKVSGVKLKKQQWILKKETMTMSMTHSTKNKKISTTKNTNMTSSTNKTLYINNNNKTQL